MEVDIFDIRVGQSLEQSGRRLVILRGGNIRVPSPHGHAPDLDIRLKPVDFRGVVHVAEPSLLVDEALGFTVVVETTRDALSTIRKHLDSLGVPLLTPGSGGLVEKGDAFVPPLNQMLVGEGRVPVTLLGTEILSVEGVELGGEYETKDLRDRTLPRVWLTDDEEQTLVFDFTSHRTSEALEHVLRDLLSPEHAHEELVPNLVEYLPLLWDIVDTALHQEVHVTIVITHSFLVAAVTSVFESYLSIFGMHDLLSVRGQCHRTSSFFTLLLA